jgi:hypothetical protein
MGKTYIPKYCVVTLETRVISGRLVRDSGTFAWKGRVSPAKLEAWRAAMNKSFGPGGSNEHLAGSRIHNCKVIENGTGRIVAEFKAPLFEIVL